MLLMLLLVVLLLMLALCWHVTFKPASADIQLPANNHQNYGLLLLLLVDVVRAVDMHVVICIIRTNMVIVAI